MDLEDQNTIDLFFTDECGFSLTPCIPYGWILQGKQRTIRSTKGLVANVFGLLSRNGRLKVYTTQSSIDSDFIIQCIDEVAQNLSKPTVLIMDNAPWHKSNKMVQMQKQWEQKDLYLFFLPTYSPHLNLIEILWRKIKYEWLRPQDYLSAQNLSSALSRIVKMYDNQFCINFSKNFLCDT